ncbi:prohead core protease [Vibrio phage YC]|uniref:Prohead core protease n=1 Tax=Vibrio phage YC TaxID=2267403 RepID=A0A384ZSA7_9CAUD|nr:prohead core protease [Vibrio phage YC]AXC34517.1 prohead core protease [Vibrio phage YC]QJT71413.1 prohead assembly (scaffolding) protein [Vibrio phage vB_VcorM_GR28A]
MSLNMIVEHLHGRSQLEILTEATAAGGKKLYLEGPMVMCNQTNRNGRNYDLDRVGIPSVEAYNRDFVSDRRAIGEVEHPDYPMPKLSKAAVKIKDPLTWVGENAVGKAEVLNNVNGQIIASLVEADFNMAVSTRGLGDVVADAHGVDQVLEGFMLTAVDVVDRPSGQVCYMKAIKESVIWENEGDFVVPKSFSKRIDTVIAENKLLENDFMYRFEKALSKLG